MSRRHPLRPGGFRGASLAVLIAGAMPAAGAVPATTQAPGGQAEERRAQEAAPPGAAAVDPGAPVASWTPPAVRNHPFPLTLQSIMRAEEIVGQSPQAVSWTDDSRWIYFRWLPAGHEWDADRELWRVPAEGGEPELIDDPVRADSLQVTFADGDVSSDRRWRVTSHRGDLWLVDREDLTVRRLSETRDQRTAPHFSRDDREVFYRSEGQVHSLDLETGAVRQLTDVREGPPDEEPEAEGHRRFLEEQQVELFEHIRRRQAREEEREARQEVIREREVHTVHTGGHGEPVAITLDRDGRNAAVQTSMPAEGTELVGVPRWITEDGYTAFDDTRVKVGDEQARAWVGIHPVGSDTVRWLDVAEAVATYAAEEAPVGPHLPEQRDAVRDGELEVRTVQFRGWSDSGEFGLLSAISIDDKHRWILSVEAATGDLTVLEHLADSAWVAGPCFGCMGWVPDAERVYYVSEADRFAHLYAVNADGSGRAQLTSGEWEVLSVEIPEDRSRFHLRTNEGSPFDQHFYHMAFDGSDRVRITEGEGRFLATPSPDGSRLAVVHSTGDRPDELYVAAHEPGAALERVTLSPDEEWLDFPWVDPEIIHFEARDGAEVPARIYRPADLGADANGAAVLFVHGAGYLQNVHNWWSSYYREYMFHHFLAAQGFTVLDIDYRASAGYGRDWRTAIYRWMGGADLQDHVDGVEWLVAEEGIDPERIGIYGGSYGGFITLMALFTEPAVFHAGGALRSVTDWAHYNHPYTSRILNEPHEDPEAYEQSSPIYFAEGLEGHLLMGHPMYDTNVHFSDIVRLTQRLIELGKENWELSVYPTENHGMVEPASWVDQYRRIYELFWRTLSEPGCREGTGVCELPVFSDGGGS